jgi:hypothetical protein
VLGSSANEKWVPPQYELNAVSVTHKRSLDAEYFDKLCAASADPWNFETSEYELNKYRATAKALGSKRFRNALETGCWIGVLTSILADRCANLLSVDVSPEALKPQVSSAPKNERNLRSYARIEGVPARPHRPHRRFRSRVLLVAENQTGFWFSRQLLAER